MNTATKNTNRRRLVASISWETLLVILLALVVFAASLQNPDFFTGSNWSNLLANFVEIALMALPLALIAITADIDLSVASILGLASSLLGVLWSMHVPMPLAIVLCLFAGGLAGMLNGLLITRLGLSSLAVTIGTLAVYRGLSFVLLGDQAIADFPVEYTALGFDNVPGLPIPIPFALFLVLALLTYLVLHHTPFGRTLYAIGSNPVAARFSGVAIEKTKMKLFVYSGVISALAGIVYTFRFASARADNGTGFELAVIAAVFLGGVSVFGGKGSLLGVLLSLFLIGVINNALTLIDVSNEMLTIVTGSLLIFSVLIPNLMARWREVSVRRKRLKQL